ncbi:hypothetical protein FQR65_LT16071 [Abscondita terminalis]|nr:hypothetical protein FQR65_LT16071 [Abscondita terminalis]
MRKCKNWSRPMPGDLHIIYMQLIAFIFNKKCQALAVPGGPLKRADRYIWKTRSHDYNVDFNRRVVAQTTSDIEDGQNLLGKRQIIRNHFYDTDSKSFDDYPDPQCNFDVWFSVRLWVQKRDRNTWNYPICQGLVKWARNGGLYRRSCPKCRWLIDPVLVCLQLATSGGVLLQQVSTTIDWSCVYFLYVPRRRIMFGFMNDGGPFIGYERSSLQSTLAPPGSNVTELISHRSFGGLKRVSSVMPQPVPTLVQHLKRSLKIQI